MGEQTVPPERLRNLISLIRSVLDRSTFQLSADRMVEDLAEDLDLNLDLTLKDVWVLDRDRWRGIAGTGGSPPDELSSPSDVSLTSIQKQDRFWWPVPGDEQEGIRALLTLETDDSHEIVDHYYEELLPALRVYVSALHSEMTLARHETMDFPDEVTPDLDQARRSGSLDEVLQPLVESAGRLFECDNCRLFWKEGEDRLRLRVESHETGEVGSTISISQDPMIQSVIEEQKSVIINNLPEDQRGGRRGDDIRSFLSVPFRHGDRVFGALNLSSEDRDVFTRDTLEQFSALADNFALVHDITRELANLSGYVEAILSNLPVGVVSVRPESGRIHLNPEARSTLELSDERMSRQEFEAQLDRRWDDRTLLEVIDGSVQSDGPEHFEWTPEEEQSHQRTIEVFRSTVEDVEDGEAQIILVLNDVTERRLLNEQVNRAERLAALGELAAGLAHEIKNPLTSIQGFVQMLPERTDDPDFLEKTSEVIGRESRRLNALVENLVSFARPQVGSRSTFPVAEVLDDVQMLVSKQLEQNNIDYRTEIPDGLTMFGDRQKLKQVLLNLILNAVDAMGNQGTLSVSVREDEDGYVLLAVTDTGEGIDPEALNQVVNPFYTTKDEGTGLGLAISHRIVEEHGGTLEFDSTPGEGTRVEVTIPPRKLQEELETEQVDTSFRNEENAS